MILDVLHELRKMQKNGNDQVGKESMVQNE